ncbi:MAG TPA: transglycosylase domain-containing protein [Cytophagaceae bacterium]|jgi:penicillin-binding protein 1A|nr:transglycosylase domain-containing protein [Cytophagaceae bacterium]
MSSKNISHSTVKILWLSFLGGTSLFVLYIFLVSINFQNMFGEMPSLENLENPKSEEASELYTEDNVLLGKYFRENRTPIEFEKISPNLVNALIATEDSRFEEHSGIDLRGLMRVLFKTFLAGQSTAGGGSTLSQQLAKNLFSTRSAKYQGTLNNVPGLKTLIVKTKEWITAIQLERSYTKTEIMTMYLNTVDFGSNAFGVEVAARTFFDRSPDSLNVNEAAMLVGLLKAPTMFSPVENPSSAIGRRNTVLDQMEKYGYLTTEQFDSLQKIPIYLRYNVENHNQGLATYFRSLSTNFLMGWCKERGLDLYSDGLRIYSTIDSRMQKYAEDAVSEHMKDLQKKFFQQWGKKNPWLDEKGKEIPNFIENAAKRTDRYRALKQIHGKDTLAIIKEMKKKVKMSVFSWNNPSRQIDTLMSPYDSIKYYKHFLHTGFLAMDPHSGYIKAWVGGINHKYFKYDHVRQGKRQPGSTFKPIVYATALDLGYTPCYELPDLPVGFPTGDKDNSVWTPQNSDGKFSGDMFTLRRAMANSINSITANLIRKVHPETVVEYAKRLGITSPLDAVPALCLGVCDVSLYEMVGAYGTFANEGVYTEPFFITRIEDKNGNVLQEFIPKTVEAINEETAYMMIYMLRGATEEKGGTALGLNQFGLLWQGGEIGGKTGTTQNYSDGWFIGVVPKLVAGAWVGGDDRCIHFRSMDLGQGARMAMPIWGLFMQKIFKDKSLGIKQAAFAKPSKPLSVELDCKKYKKLNMQGDSMGVNMQRVIPKEYEQ